MTNRNPHIKEAHDLWRTVVHQGDIVIDATCGNGHDTLVLSKMALTDNSGAVYAIDKQSEAIKNSELLLKNNLDLHIFSRIIFKKMSHENFPAEIHNETVALIVYNLGYLPGGNKNITTKTDSTLLSLQNALKLIKKGGWISITCYPGHEEGKKEERELLKFTSELNSQEWSCSHKRWINRSHSPSLLLLNKL